MQKGKIISSLAWKFLERCSVQLITFIVSIVVARILSPSDYGAVAIVLVFVNFSSVIVEGGLSLALVQKRDVDSQDFSTICIVSIAAAIIIYCILFLLAPTIAKIFGCDVLSSVLRFLGLSLILFAFNSIQKAYISRHLLFRKLFTSSLWSVLISGVVGIIMALEGFGIWALATQTFLSQFVVTIIMLFSIPWRPRLEFSWNRLLPLFDYGSKVMVTNIMINMAIHVRSLLIGKFFTPADLAFFDRGRHFPAIIIDNVNASIQAVMFPVLCSIKDNRARVKELMKRSIRTSTYVIYPIVTGMILVADPMVRCVLTDKWIGAVVYIQIFCVSYLLMPLQITNIEAIKALGYSGVLLKLEGIKKVIEFVILLVSFFIGVEAIAWGIVIYNIFSLFVNCFPNKRLLSYGVLEQISDVFPALFLSFIMLLVLSVCNMAISSTLFMLIFDVTAGILIYIALSYIFKVESYLFILSQVKERFFYGK